uniref:TPR_REGION domain-containing protein n=1 Tax=Syphacia muris TaxID=451379 RepID=A0A0N5AFT6_9BILA
MAFSYRLKQSVEIPLKDSPDNALERRISDFCVDVWNLTQSWEILNVKVGDILEAVINDRLRLIYSSQVNSLFCNRYYQKENCDQCEVGNSSTGVETVSKLNEDQRLEILENLLQKSEQLSAALKEFNGIFIKLQSAFNQLPALRNICEQQQLSPNSYLGKKFGELVGIAPAISSMYQQELAAKRAAISDLKDFESRKVFMGITASWNHEAFIDKNILSILYALELIELELSSLPEDGNEVLAILKGEHAALHYWIDVALAYYAHGNEADFVRILELAGSEASLEYNEYPNDQMRALDILAAYYVIQCHKEKSKEKKKEWHTKATLLYTTADKIIMYDTYHLLGRAYFCLLEGKIDQAEQQFNFVLNQLSENIPATLGKACIFFQKKEFRKALNCYKCVLRKLPDCPANVRLGIGYCLAKLGRMDKARAAFQRVLDLEPENVNALVALAILDLNTGSEGIQKGVQLLSRAYNVDRENPVVLNHLANHFFYKKMFDRVEHLAWHAFQITDNEAMRAESSFQLARSYHFRNNFEKAFQHYYQATQFASPNFVLPYYGLGQMYIHREEFDNAISCFEKVLKVFPNNYDTLKVLGSLYAHSDPADQKEKETRRQKAKEILKKVVDMCPDDIEALIDYAQLIENINPQGSLDAYEKVIELLQANMIDVPPEIINNIGSLQLSLGRYEEAKDSFELALKKLADDSAEELKLLQITVKYNLARSNEMLCLFNTAEQLYKNILQEKSNYIDCYMRLGCLARDKGQIYESSVWFKEGMSVCQTHADAWLLIANLHMSKNEWAPAQKKFEYVMKLTEHHNDPYSFVGLGNVWLETLFSITRRKEKDKDYRERALNMYSKALKVHPKNLYAANGIGCILAQKGAIQEARDIFAQVREATAEFPDVWMNIAHVYMDQKQYVAAIQMYDNCMKKFRKFNHIALLQYLARAYYKAGKLVECKQILEKAACEAPDNLLIKFNHAFTLKKLAMQMLKDDKSSLEMVIGAVEDLKTAERFFSYISQNREENMGQARLVSRTASAAEARDCSDLLKQAKTYLQRAKAQDEEEQRQKQQQEEERQALKRRLEEEAREREEKTKRQVEALKQMRREYVEKTKEYLRLPTVVEERKARNSGSGRRRRDKDGDEFVNDSSDMGDWGDADVSSRLRKEKKRGRKRHEKRIDSSNESGAEGDRDDRRKKDSKKRKRREERREAELSAKQKAKVKSREFVQSDEDSSDDDDTISKAEVTT